MSKKKTLRDDLAEIGEAAEEGLDAVSGALFSLKLFLTGIMLVGIGVSQAAFGWIGNGFLYRVLYPIPLIGFGILFLWACLGSKPTDDRRALVEPKSTENNDATSLD